MSWKPYNPNPAGRSVGDCAIRAVSKALDIDWDEADVWPVVDELMDTIKALNERLYNGVMRKLR